MGESATIDKRLRPSARARAMTVLAFVCLHWSLGKENSYRRQKDRK